MAEPSSDSLNPYAAPESALETPDPFLQDDFTVRRQFIDCEANVLSIGGLLILGGVVLGVTFGFGALYFLNGMGGSGGVSLLACGATLAIGQVVVGLGVRKLNPQSRVAAIVVCGLWMLFIPVGTFFGGISLWYLLRPASLYIFTPQYRAIIERTPEVELKTSKASLVILIFVLVAVAGLITFRFRL